ncbi:MAG: hypothetical protein EBS01_07150 [Verrucomicrobia bacterium]|nr:hypothetical protein [Verrucomicrobiota bacterium]
MEDAPVHSFDHDALNAGLKTLRLSSPFRIAHGVSWERQVLRVNVRGGFGEAPVVPYYQENPCEALEWLGQWDFYGQWLPSQLSEAPRMVRLGLDVLRHDLLGKASGMPVWQMLQLPNPSGATACRSMAIPTDLALFSEQAKALSGQFRVLKLKLGSGNLDWDEAIVAAAREAAPAAVLFGDVNGGWTPQEAVRMVPELKRRGLAFLEQPVHHAGGIEAWRELVAGLGTERLPLFADESVQNAGDVSLFAGLVQGVNVKLLKCGGFNGGLEMIRRARGLGLQTLLGCMIESSLGVTAASHLAGSVDWIDLDGHLYLADDDYKGLSFGERGELCVPAQPGIGATPVISASAIST